MIKLRPRVRESCSVVTESEGSRVSSSLPHQQDGGAFVGASRRVFSFSFRPHLLIRVWRKVPHGRYLRRGDVFIQILSLPFFYFLAP